MKSTGHLAALVALTAAMTIGACGTGDPDKLGATGTPPGDGTDAGTDPPGTGIPFEPVGPIVYVEKVKNLLTGLPATDAEVQSVIKDPTALKGLIDTWMALPEFEVRMRDFFRNAFQQNSVDLPTMQASLNSNFQVNSNYATTLARNIMDSFALTAAELVKEGQPFNQTLGTDRYMLTTAMMSTMSFLDDMHVGDDRKSLVRLAARTAVPQYTLDTASTNTLAESLDSDERCKVHGLGIPGRRRGGLHDHRGHVQAGEPRRRELLQRALRLPDGPLDVRRLPGGRQERRSAELHAGLHGQRLHRLANGHDARRRRGARRDARVLRCPEAARRDRSDAPHAAHRVLRDARVRHQLGDQPDQRSARDREPGAHRGARTEHRRREHHRELPGQRHRREPRVGPGLLGLSLAARPLQGILP